MYNEELQAQYEIKTVEQKNENGYLPSFDELIAEAPSVDMKEKWIHCRDLMEKMYDHNPRLSRFAFNTVYMVRMPCGHLEIYQHSSQSEEDLLDWIQRVDLKEGAKCSKCMTGGL